MIKEVDYPEWLANVVIVQKKNGKWRVCVDYTDLNKACPKDPYPLPHIDTMVDSTAGHELLTFLDASSGFNQIQMEPSDAEKTAFITERGYIVIWRCLSDYVMPGQHSNVLSTRCSKNRSDKRWRYILTTWW